MEAGNGINCAALREISASFRLYGVNLVSESYTDRNSLHNNKIESGGLGNMLKQEDPVKTSRVSICVA